MKQGIPERIKLIKFASKSLIFSQSYQVRDFPRVSEMVSNLNSPVNVELSFGFVDDKIPYIKGDIKLDLALTCQRCLDEVILHMQPSFKLAFVQNKQLSEELDSSFEIIENFDEEFSTIEFITDEVLLSIPMIPMHEHECASYQDTTPLNEHKRENPFAILKQLKNSNNESKE